jgi:uncharacterized protein
MSIQAKGGSALGVAVVTGASAGIGKVYADRLAKRGYDLVLVARRKERLDALAQELKQKYGVQADTLVADLGNPADLKRVEDAHAADERITVLVNNAGTSALKPSVDLPVSEVDNQMDGNAKAVTHQSLAVLPGFVKRDRGTLINVGSSLSFFARLISTSYSAQGTRDALHTRPTGRASEHQRPRVVYLYRTDNSSRQKTR